MLPKFEHLTENKTFWIAQDGDDSSANGTEDNPFSTLSKAVEYVEKFYANTRYQISFNFLTDYEDTDPEAHSCELHKNLGGFSARWIKIRNTLNKNVTICRLRSYAPSATIVENVKIKSVSNNCMSAALGGTFFLGGNITLEYAGVSKAYSLLSATKGGNICIFSNCNLTLITDTPDKTIAFNTLDGGAFMHQYESNTAFTINLNSDVATLFNASRQGRLFNFNACTVNANGHTATTDIALTNNSYMYIAGRGTAWLPTGTTDIDESSILL